MRIKRAFIFACALGAAAGAGAAPISGTATRFDLVDEFGGYGQSISTTSSNLKIRFTDDYGYPSPSTQTVTVVFPTAYYNWDQNQALPASVLYSVNNFISSAPLTSNPSITISSGNTESTLFRVRVATVTGNVALKANVPTGPMAGVTAFYPFEVLGASATFSGVSVRNGTDPVSTSSTTMTPDRDGVRDSVTIRANPPPGVSYWQAIIYSTTTGSLSNPVATLYSYGTPPEVTWFGYDNFGRTVPNDHYLVRLQNYGGTIVDDSLSIDLNSAFIGGQVIDAITSSPLAADVNVYGPGGGGYQRSSAASGLFSINGLKAGQSYGVQVAAPGYVSQVRQNVTASVVGPDFLLSPAVVLDVTATRSMGGAGTNPEIWGNLSANTTDYAQNAYGTVHFAAESAASDNGDYYNLQSFTRLNVPPGRQINLRLEIPQYGSFLRSVVTPSSGTASVVFSSTEIIKNPTVSGNVDIAPDTAPYPGISVSVQGIKQGQSSPSVFGSGWINQGQQLTSYTLYGVSAGTWTFRTSAAGYVSSSTVINVTGDVTHNFGSLSQGGVIVGTVTFVGSSASAQPFTQGFNPCLTGQLPVSVNAWAPGSGANTFSSAWTTVCVSTSASTSVANYKLSGLETGRTYELFTYLPGFQLTPPGRITVSLSTASATRNIDYQKLSGVLALTALHSTAPADDPTLIQYTVRSAFSGPDNYNVSGALTDLGGGQGGALFTGLGTGLYDVTVQNRNPGRGLTKRSAVNVVNGSTATLAMDMRNETNPTLTVSGQVSFSGNLVLGPPWGAAGAGATVNSAQAFADALGVQGATAPVVQVYSFPLRGFGQPDRQVQAVPSAGLTSATFTVTGLPPGTYLFRVMDDLTLPSQAGSGPPQPDLASTSQVVFATANVTGVNLTVSNGVNVGGAVNGGDATPRVFEVILTKLDGLAQFYTTMTVTNAAESFLIQHVTDGEYTLNVRERTFPAQFAAAPVKVVVTGAAISNANVTLVKAGSIVGKLRDADSNTLITNDNQGQFLPDNFFFYARANPWTPGGHADMTRGWEVGSNGNIYLSTSPGQEGQFLISRVMPGSTFDVAFRGFQNFDASAAAKGQKAYMPVVISGVRVEEGQTVDLGTVDLRQGVTISGQVTLAGSTQTLSNVKVTAFPAQLDGSDRHELAIESFTDEKGNYTLQGADPARRWYDVIAAPRPNNGDTQSLLAGIKYGEEVRLNVDLTSAQTAATDFALTPADGVLTGLVVTEDGGPLEQPFGDAGNSFRERKAAVVLHLEGAAGSSDNPLGEIEEDTDHQGAFNIQGLKPGAYTMRVVSVGYVTTIRSVTVKAGPNSAGTVTLRKGGSLSGNITKPDGTPPSTSEVKMIVGVDRDFREFVFSSLTANEESNQVTAYKMNGFKAGVSYSLMSVTEEDDIIELASGITFTSSTETKTQDLIFRPAPPAVFVTQSRSGDTYNIRFFSTHKLRRLTAADDDLTAIVTCPTCGGGTGAVNYSSSSISGSRDTVEVVYDGVPSESSFQLGLTFVSAKTDAETGANFVYGPSTFTFYAGIDKSRIVRIANTVGGECSLEGSAAGGEFPPGTFDVSGSSTVDVGVQSTTSSAVGAQFFASPSVAGRARALGVAEAAQRLGPAAYPSLAVYRAAMAAPDVSQQVFSNFYNIFLPAGVSHTLKKDALITLKYSDSVADPSSLNVYYFDQNNGVYLLEDNQRLVDDVNKTITVAVRHLSTFVLLNANAPVITGDAYTGTTVEAHNFPNPFDLKPRSVTLNRASSLTQAIEGTMIRVGVPSGKSGTVRIEIYDAAGALVRELTDTVAGGTYAYKNWDGRNEGGKKVASGVYIARVTVNGGDEKIFKMAVIK